MSIEPLSPSEAKSQKHAAIPDAVIETFNEMIIEELELSGYACLRQEDIIKRLEEKGLRRAEIYAKHWLDIEDIYRSKGWKVEYDKPGYNEDYPATFTFRSKRSRNNDDD